MTSKHKFPKQWIIPYEIQTQKRLKKRLLFIMTKHNMQIFKVAFFKLQNNT